MAIEVFPMISVSLHTVSASPTLKYTGKTEKKVYVSSEHLRVHIFYVLAMTYLERAPLGHSNMQ